MTTAIEHKAVLDSCHALERDGYRITYLAPSSTGQVSPEQVEAALREDTVLVSVMHANNEIGSINDIASIGAVCRAHEVLFHVDAAQTVGKLPLDLGELPVDLLSIAAHKFYGPKGSGALYVRRQPPVYLDAQIHGGGHERGMRSGTLPCHQIVGLGAAAELAGVEMAAEAERLERFRQLLWQGLSGIGGVSLNGAATQRLPGLLNVSFAGVEGETLLLAVPDLAVSTGSACTSASLEPSYVLRAIGLPDELAHSSLRLSMGRFTSEAEVEHTVASLARALARLRGSEPACA